MKLARHDDDLFLGDFIHETMSLGDTPRPESLDVSTVPVYPALKRGDVQGL